MAERTDAIRGGVIRRREAAGQPDWPWEKTLAICIEVDRALAHRKLSPAPKFREAVECDDEQYLRTLVFGCHFSWINPR